MRIYGVTGWKNSGKTGLMERLVRDITARGFKVSTIKHAHHRFDVDHPGKDSYRHREAGASEVVLASQKRIAVMRELRGASEPSLEALLANMEPADLVLIEGYKRDRHAKIEANRQATCTDLIARDDPTIRALATDQPHDIDLPVFDLDDTQSIADFILNDVGLTGEANAPKPLRNDCFALPQGVHWTPVDEALTQLRNTLSAQVTSTGIPLEQAQGRILTKDIAARRSHPPLPNSAVDGYGFAGGISTDGETVMPLIAGRAAAGVPFDGTVPTGCAVRILTGAALPAGVETVVLEEDVSLRDGAVVLKGTIKRGANTRKAGEDVKEGEVALKSGTKIGAAELALLSAIGVGFVEVFEPLRVAIMSTGDELVPPGAELDGMVGKICDANRPMLAAMVERWGFELVDLGILPDDRASIRAGFDEARAKADVLLTSGGASAGDEDHVSALLNETGALEMWRIAMKPGRPLALGMWDGMPIFGLPGNPVAAMVCAAVFARPALHQMAGAGWAAPQGFEVPAGFTKSKKAGRSEYLRARIENGRVHVFASEGSGRISGLAWADGLVSLPPEAMSVALGDPVLYYPWSSFGL